MVCGQSSCFFFCSVCTSICHRSISMATQRIRNTILSIFHCNPNGISCIVVYSFRPAQYPLPMCLLFIYSLCADKALFLIFPPFSHRQRNFMMLPRCLPFCGLPCGCRQHFSLTARCVFAPNNLNIHTCIYIHSIYVLEGPR